MKWWIMEYIEAWTKETLTSWIQLQSQLRIVTYPFYNEYSSWLAIELMHDNTIDLQVFHSLYSAQVMHYHLSQRHTPSVRGCLRSLFACILKLLWNIVVYFFLKFSFLNKSLNIKFLFRGKKIKNIYYGTIL